ncbi:MAG: hypothetical protein PHP02_08170 [Eubacteriales bacterium]|nr:hypothetical protein [Eubacteriales bacterium]
MLRRNYQDLTFCPQDKETDLLESRRRTLSAIKEKAPDMRVYYPTTLSALDQARLMESGLLPTSFIKLSAAALATGEEDTLSVAINTGEHLLLGARDKEGKLEGLTARVRSLEEDLALTDHPYAYDERFGYLSFNPVLAGSGLYVSLVMHLPMLSFLKQIRALSETLKQRYYCFLKPLGQTEDHNQGNLYRVGNASSFSREDEDIIRQVTEAAKVVAEKEALLRDKAFHEARVTPLADRAWRAYGILHYARRLARDDYLSLWSRMRLGAVAGILPVPVAKTNQMLELSGDGRYLTDGADRKTCPFRRADEVRQALSGG